MSERKVPKIRFPGFTGEWEEQELGTLVTRYEDHVETPHNGYERLGIRSHAKGTFHSYVAPGEELETAKMQRVASDKFIVNITFAWEHAVAVTDAEDAGKLVSHRFPQFSFRDGLNPSFFKYAMLDKRFKKHLELSSPGGAGRNRVLKIEDMLKYRIAVPSIEEQQKVSWLLDNVNDHIVYAETELNIWKELKKGMLQKMFPKEGESVPEIRFPGFTVEWKSYTLNDLLAFQNGFNGKNTSFHGETPLISVMDILNNDFIMYDTIRGKASLNEKEKQRYIVEYGDVLFQRSSENFEDAGTSNVYLDRNKAAAFGGFVIRGKKNNDFDPVFMKYLLATDMVRIQITSRAQGAQHINVSQSTLEGVSLRLPDIQEQEMIGNAILKVDKFFNLQERELEKWQTLKKALLQKMFV